MQGRWKPRENSLISASISTNNSNSSNPSPSLDNRVAKASSGSAMWRDRPENFARWTHQERSARSRKHTNTSSERKSNLNCLKAVKATVFANNGCVLGMATWGGCKEANVLTTPDPRSSCARPRSSSSNRGEVSSSWATASAWPWSTRTGPRLERSQCSFRPTNPPAAKETRHNAASRLSDSMQPSSDTRCNRGDSTHSKSSAARLEASTSPRRKCSRRRLLKASPAGNATASCEFSNAKSSANASKLLQVGINNCNKPSSQRSAREEQKRSDGQQRELNAAARMARQTPTQERNIHTASKQAKAEATTPTGIL
mmetsp:Transcript_67540/g.135692  ORF Transcript_67540/g.135692 Transcript_67540/m.135692 type:complete len:314 (+) Transcript_67540:471-1412(+)